VSFGRSVDEPPLVREDRVWTDQSRANRGAIGLLRGGVILDDARDRRLADMVKT
jgi:hypothetical protein